MLDELVKKIINWSKVSELLEVYLLKIKKLESVSSNQLQNARLISRVIGDAIHDIYIDEKTGIDFSRIPRLVNEYKLDKDKFWFEVLSKYIRDKENYPVNEINNILTHFLIMVSIFENYDVSLIMQ